MGCCRSGPCRLAPPSGGTGVVELEAFAELRVRDFVGVARFLACLELLDQAEIVVLLGEGLPSVFGDSGVHENVNVPVFLVFHFSFADPITVTTFVAWKPFTQQYHYLGLIKKFETGKAACDAYKIPYAEFCESLKFYNACATRKWSPDGKDRFDNTPFDPTDEYYVGIVTPLLHYTMGGIKITTKSEVCTPEGKVIPGFFAGGEAAGGIHNKNRLAGNSLVDCVVYGRTAGESAAKYCVSVRARL